MKNFDYRSVLKDELERRKAANPAYSLRAFARQLVLSPAQLSKILSGKKSLTPKMAIKIAEALAYSPMERAALLESTVAENYLPSLEPQSLQTEEFHLIADWFHYAILSLSDLKKHKSDPRWMAAQLGISTADASAAIARLLKLKIIEVRGGKIRQIMRPIRTTTDIPSAAIRRYHLQNLDNAKTKLEQVSVENREFSAITMAISRKRLPMAKKMITEFKRKLATLLENGEKEAVYTLAIQLFPVSRLENKK